MSGKSRGVDYTKWDKMVNDMSDSEDEEGNFNNPEVTTFDKPQSVTFGGTAAAQAADGLNSDGSIQAGTSAPAPACSEHIGTATATASNTSQQKRRAPVTDSELAENGGEVFIDNTDAPGGNGAGRLRYVWRQTREDVTVVIPVPPGVRAGDIAVSLTAKPGTIAEEVANLIRVTMDDKPSRQRMEDSSGGGQQKMQMENAKETVTMTVLLDGELPFQAKLEQEIDWELKDLPGTCVSASRWWGNAPGVSTTKELAGLLTVAKGEELDLDVQADKTKACGSRPQCRGLEITLRKHCPIPNAVVWWRSFLKGDPEIDVSNIQGRAKSSGHQSAWAEALGMFKAKMADRNAQGKIDIDAEEDEAQHSRV